MSAGATFDDVVDVVEAVTACQRPLLLATDVDGTLAPIAPRPEQARLAPDALGALLRLADLDGVEVAVVSGRSLDELVHQFALPPTLHLVGSHGAEMEHSSALDDAEAGLLADVVATLEGIAATTPNARVERKPFAAALHVRNATPGDAAAALVSARGAFAAQRRVHVHEGHQVYEVAVRHHTKAIALAQLRARLHPAGLVFFGDDLSDETAFEVLAPDEVGVKVGPGPTAARYRLASPADVVRVFEMLC